jgi:uncharacterized membrane protein
MSRSRLQNLTLGLFCAYLALLPGSTITVALDLVPAWGVGLGGVLLLLQGLAALCWLATSYGRRGVLAGAVTFLAAWAVEHIGETTGLLFGRYRYTELLQPQIGGVVPLPITCAWLMVALGAWQLASIIQRRLSLGQAPLSHEAAKPRNERIPLSPKATKPHEGQVELHHQPSPIVHKPQATSHRPQVIVRPAITATLVLLLDLQIETIATRVNSYWIWLDSGPFYGVPSLNFVMWWLVGLLMAGALAAILPARAAAAPGGRWARLFAGIPALLYCLSAAMFTIINLARGYTLAGLIGVGVLALLAGLLPSWGLPVGAAIACAARRTSD